MDAGSARHLSLDHAQKEGREGQVRVEGIGNAKSDQIIEEVGGGEKKISRQWFSALL